MFEKKQGYDLSLDHERHLLKIRAWGFWDAEVSGKYETEFKQAITEMSTNGAGWNSLVDVTEYTPQSAKVQDIIRKRMIFAAEHGLKKEARIVRNLPTKWQMEKIVRKSDLPVSANFRSEDEALRWLMSE